ncbi:2-vinyl bacteriochlorophyllide hydratase [Acidiphilium sp.]|uniref:2-vinyl bacteriochlorophyllide hydratase n=1 Tax=Acidiphilium sp. TaxID=527 RepID=UPI00258DA73B|nr:2-vinyl bacteriochlorophyllide hydratase [Acidiphilium sp.]
MDFTRIIDRLVAPVNCCPWQGHAYGISAQAHPAPRRGTRRAPYLYSVEERRRRDTTPWTTVQAILAPVQFAVFLISVCLVLRYLATGEGLAVATASILAKTAILFTIMITGAIWENAVFGQYLFAPAFFWEDVFSVLVIGLHVTYVAVLVTGAAPAHTQMLIALAAYGTYLVNATQFLMKLRAARLEAAPRAAIPG